MLSSLSGDMFKRPLFKASDSELIEKFHKLEDFFTLADLLEFNAYGLRRIFYEIRRQGKHYQEFSIKKKSGGERQIFAPDSKLKFIQRRLAYILSLIYLGRPSVHGFMRGRSIITNAELHARRRLLLNIDLEDFFPTIHFGRVRGRLLAHPYDLSRSGATIVAGFCCHWGKLPQGAPTSPIISNMICSKLDYELQRLTHSEHCTYSRYADDIVFSTTRGSFSENMVEITTGKQEIGSKLNTFITGNGFKVNQKKTRIRFNTERQEVTGLVVNSFPNVKRSLVKQIRAMLYAWKKFGIESTSKHYGYRNENSFYEVLRGKINFIKLVKTKEDSTYRVLAEKFNDQAGKPVFEIVPVKDWPDEELIPVGGYYKGTDLLERLFSKAEKEIFVLDNYLTGKIIGLLEGRVVKNQSLSIKILISRNNILKYNDCINALKGLIKIHPEIQMDCREGSRENPGGLHDRYIVIDGAEIFQSGHSFAELGKSATRISRMRNQRLKSEALIEFESLFINATKINLAL